MMHGQQNVKFHITIAILITVVIITQCYNGSTVYIAVANRAKLIYQ
jgi:hypothetical protein